jgi:hypothetical protein
VCVGLMWLKTGIGSGDPLGRGNRTADSIKLEEFDQLNDY